MGPRRQITFPMFGDGIFTQEGDQWKHSRELLRPSFHYKQYADLGIFREAADDLLANIPEGGGVIDLQPLFFGLTLDTTTAFLFGESIKSLKSPESVGEETFAKSFNIAQEYVAKRFRLLDLYWLIGGKEFRDACDKVHNFADQIIDRNLSIQQKGEEEKRNTFLRSLAERTAHRPALRGQIINLLTAGRDSTACLLSWTL
jgi:cytochrome P450